MRKTMKFIGGLLPVLLLFSFLLPFSSAAAENTEVVILDDGSPEEASFCILGDRLYYNGAAGICSCALDGTDTRTLCSGTGTLFSDGEKLYLGSQSEIIRIAEDGEEELLLRVYPLVNEGAFAVMNTMSHFAARDGSIYYVLTMAQDYELWRIDSDGSSNQRVCSICPPASTILDVFFRDDAESIFVQYRDSDTERWTLLGIPA